MRWEGKWIEGHVGLIYAIDAEHIAVVGPGRIVGNPALGGRPTPQSPLRRPALVEPIGWRDVRLEDFSTEYQRIEPPKLPDTVPAPSKPYTLR